MTPCVSLLGQGCAFAQNTLIYFLLPPSQIVARLTFLASSLTTRLIQKLCANIVKFKSFLKNFY